MKQSIIVLVEHLKNQIADISFEMLGRGRKLADAMNLHLVAVVFGRDMKDSLHSLGIADNILFIDSDFPLMPGPRLLSSVLKDVFIGKNGHMVLLGGTNITSGVGSLLSSKLNVPFINFCTNIVSDNAGLIVTSFLFGGKMLSSFDLGLGKGIVSIYPGSFPAEDGKVSKIAPVEVISFPEFDEKIVFKNYIEPEPGDVDITKENILVSIGRGIESQDNLDLAGEIIKTTGGAIAASRPIIDLGWLPLCRQVGKSGMSVKPKLYLALGISGAPEHVEGMKDSGLIIAINKDPAAPIFNVAHYGIVADVMDILPSLIEELKKRKGMHEVVA